jgi:hypothetical protein
MNPNIQVRVLSLPLKTKVMKNIIVFTLLCVAGLVALIEGTISLLSWGLIKTHLGLRIGKYSEEIEKFY